MKSRVETETFAATDHFGKPSKILVHRRFCTYPSVEGIETPMPGSITTESGEPLAHEGKGKYRSASGLSFTSNDPKAP
jgi:hypothetical protein